MNSKERIISCNEMYTEAIKLKKMYHSYQADICCRDPSQAPPASMLSHTNGPRYAMRTSQRWLWVVMCCGRELRCTHILTASTLSQQQVLVSGTETGVTSAEHTASGDNTHHLHLTPPQLLNNYKLQIMWSINDQERHSLPVLNLLFQNIMNYTVPQPHQFKSQI